MAPLVHASVTPCLFAARPSTVQTPSSGMAALRPSRSGEQYGTHFVDFGGRMLAA